MVRCKGTCLTGLRCKKSGNPMCHVHKIDCGICLDQLTNSIDLDCGHKFCEKCIAPWIITKQENSNCPMCRNKIDADFIECANMWGLQRNLVTPVKVYLYTLDVLDDYEKLIVSVFVGSDIGKFLTTYQLELIASDISSEVYDKLYSDRTEKIFYMPKTNDDFPDLHVIVE